MLDKLKWAMLALLAALLLATYSSLSLQLVPLTNLFLGVAPKLGLALLALLAGKAVLELTMPLLERHAVSPDMRPTTRKLWSFIVWSIACLVVLAIFIGDLSALLVSAGLVGFGLTFALQRPILSFVGWLNITWKRLYATGDSVEIGELKGDVVSIDILTTTVIDKGRGGQVTFPNSLVLERAVANFTKDIPYAWDEVAVCAQAQDIGSVKTLLLQASDEVLGNKKMAENIKEYNAALQRQGLEASASGPEVYVELGDNGAVLRLRYLVNSRRLAEARSALSEHIAASRARMK